MTHEDLILDRYEPLGTAGAGGFGTVQVAWDPRIQRKVAIKTIQLSEADARRANLPGAITPAAAPTAPAARGWRGVQPWNEYLEETEAQDVPVVEPVSSLAHLPGLDEARTAAKLQDLRIVTVFDFEVRGQVAYLIMEYVEGITLTRLMAEYEDYLTLDVVAAVFDAVAGALTVAHKAGVLHLDIKPDNILINADGQAKVTDFGLATLADASGTGHAGGGTIGYMPLEQMRRQPLDARTDEWSLASVTYEMLTGDNPFHADTLADAEAAIENAELVLPSLCWEDVDPQIDDVIFYALDPDRDQRYATVAGFAEEADKFLGNAKAGQKQLAAIVSDAIGAYDEEEFEDYDGDGEADAEGAAGWGLGRGRGQRAPREKRPSRLAQRKESVSGLKVAGRVLAAAAAAYLSWFAPTNMPFFTDLFGTWAIYAAIGVAAVVAIIALVRPYIGVAIALVLAGIALVVMAQPLAGAVLIVVGVAWCYAFYQLGAHNDRPVIRAVVAVILAAIPVALAILLPLPQDLLPVAIASAVALITSGLR